MKKTWKELFPDIFLGKRSRHCSCNVEDGETIYLRISLTERERFLIEQIHNRQNHPSASWLAYLEGEKAHCLLQQHVSNAYTWRLFQARRRLSREKDWLGVRA